MNISNIPDASSERKVSKVCSNDEDIFWGSGYRE